MYVSKRSTALIQTFATCALALLSTGSLALAQDSNLFRAKVAPNVMLMVDNSGSMNHIVWHPGFDPNTDSTCSRWVSGGGPNTTWIFRSDLSLTACGNTRTLYADTNINGYTRITERYLNWYFSDEAEPYFKGTNNNSPDNRRTTTTMCFKTETPFRRAPHSRIP